MSFFKKTKSKGGDQGYKVPDWDPYGIWSKKKDFFGVKKDLQTVLPGVTMWEERRLSKIQDYIKESTKSEECNVPMHMLNDVYSMYMNKDFKSLSDAPHIRLKKKVIEKTYNSLTKIVTEDSSIFSQMITKEIGVYLQKVEEQISEELEKNGQGKGEGESAFDQSVGSGDQDGEGDSQDGEELGGGVGKGTNMKGHGDLNSQEENLMKKIDDILEKSTGDLDNAIKKAEKQMEELEEKLGKDVLKELSDNNEDFLEQIDNIKKELNSVCLNKENIKNILSKILNKSQNYFSKNAIIVEESIFETDEIEDLFGLEHLNPIFGMAGILDIGNEGKIYTGKIDLYLDCSGSMGSTQNFDGKNIRMIDLVKGIAMVLYRMGMIDKLYFFDGGIYEIKNINEFTILGFNKSGGTDFDKVVRQCQTNGRNSVVITDGQDSCSSYAHNIFWVGVGGTTFGGSGGAFDQYRKTAQCVTYDSNKNIFDYVR